MGVISSKLPLLHKRKEDLNEDCPICLCEVEEKSLACGHKVHIDCLIMQIEHGKPNEEDHLSFNFICCPLCRQLLKSRKLKTILKPIKQLKSTTDKLAISSLEKFALDVLGDSVKAPEKAIEKMKKHEKIELAYRKLVFYKCKECLRPYCGGAVSCAQLEQEAQEKKKKKIIVRRKKQNGVVIPLPPPPVLPHQYGVIPLPPPPPPFVVNPFYAPAQREIPLPPPPPPFAVNDLDHRYVPLYPFHYAKNKQNNIIDYNRQLEIEEKNEEEEEEEYFDSPLFALFSEIPLPSPPPPLVNCDVPLLCSIKLEEEEKEKEEEKKEEEGEEYFDSPLFKLFSEIPLPPSPPPFVVNPFYAPAQRDIPLPPPPPPFHINQNNNVNQLNDEIRNSKVDVIEIENHNNINNNNDIEGDESEYEEIEEEVDEEVEIGEEVNEDGDIIQRKKGRYCLDCATVKVKRNCAHPITDLIFKCVACCSPATFYCGATNFYCNHCHSNLHSFKVCEGIQKCPLGISHPPNQCGTHGGGQNAIPFVLGCGICGPVRRTFDDNNSAANQFYVLYNNYY